MPLASSLRSKDYSRDPERNNIDYWINTVAGTMLHEMHHMFIDPSRDVSLWPPLKFFQPGGPDETFDTAYEYAGATALADQVVGREGKVGTGRYQDLWQNAESVAIFSVGVFLEGNDVSGSAVCA